MYSSRRSRQSKFPLAKANFMEESGLGVPYKQIDNCTMLSVGGSLNTVHKGTLLISINRQRISLPDIERAMLGVRGFDHLSCVCHHSLVSFAWFSLLSKITELPLISVIYHRTVKSNHWCLILHFQLILECVWHKECLTSHERSSRRGTSERTSADKYNI